MALGRHRRRRTLALSTGSLVAYNDRDAGARGYAVTTAAADDTWRHTFHFTK